MYQCWVRGCVFKAGSLYGGDLPLCALHDVKQTHDIIEASHDPMHGWSATGTPIVIPCGTLEYREPVLAKASAIFPHECPMLAKAKPGGACAWFDLMWEPE